MSSTKESEGENKIDIRLILHLHNERRTRKRYVTLELQRLQLICHLHIILYYTKAQRRHHTSWCRTEQLVYNLGLKKETI